jgi:hypothetical protein
LKAETQDNALLVKNQPNDPEFFLWIKCGEHQELVGINPRGFGRVDELAKI